MLIASTINCSKPPPYRLTSTIRNIKSIDKTSIANDLIKEVNGLDLRGTVDEMLDKYDLSVCSVIDAHAPPQLRSRTIKPRLPWSNDDINVARRTRRKCDRAQMAQN